MIPINEIFGPTIQGEGEIIGIKTIFIRTNGCDFSCSWCDSKYAWGNDYKYMTPIEVFNEVIRLSDLRSCSSVTITGGNPCLISEPMKEVIRLLKQEQFEVYVETQGSIWQDWLLDCDHVVISPKPLSSGMETDFETLKKIVQKLILNKIPYSLKIVVFDEKDYKYAKVVYEYLGFSRFCNLYLQPGNSQTNNEQFSVDALLAKLKWLANKVINDYDMNEVKVLPQLHVLLWGNERGK